MSKPKWSVEIHGECPFPDMFDVVEVAGDLPPSGVAVGETAHFIGTMTGTTTVNNFAIPLSVMPGTPRRGWAPLEEGVIHLGPAAGGCVVMIVGTVALDFSDGTTPSSDHQVYGGVGLTREGGSGFSSGTQSIDGDGETTEFPLGETSSGGAFMVGGVLAVNGGGSAQNGPEFIEDGVAEVTVVVYVTRIAPAPVLPA